MDKQTINKMFDEKMSPVVQGTLSGAIMTLEMHDGDTYEIGEKLNSQIKDFIFSTVISEVLKSIVPKYYNKNDRLMWYGHDSLLKEKMIEDKVKELYNITL